MKQINKIVTLSLLTSSVLLGATPNIGDIERQVQPPKEVQQKQTPLIEINGVKKYAPTMKDDKSGKTIFVKNFKINGAIHIEETKLQSLISSYNAKDLTFTQIQEVTSIITKEYRNQGYFVARAYIPVQDINKNNGVFMIDIIEGNYGEFKLNNKSLVKDSSVQGMLDNAKARDNVVSTNTLERSMLIINDTPGVVVTQADVKPGSEVGTSDFIITTEKTNRVNGYALTDNAGSRYTGKNRLMAGLNVNSPFDIGDKIALSGLISNASNLLNGRVAYSVPLASNGLIGEVSYSQTTYSLTEDYKSLDAQGTAKTLDASLKYPVIRSRAENLYLNTTVANKDLEDKSNQTGDAKKDTQSITVGSDYDKAYIIASLNNSSKISFNVKYGKLDIHDETTKSNDELGADTNGNYSKVNLDLSNTMYFTNELSLDTALKLQYALGNKNLDGSEDISIGGSSGVKIYPDSELSAENGYVFNAELKYKLPNVNSLKSTVGVFYDRGRAFMANSSNVTFESKSLQDVGIGYYASYDKYFGQAQVAWNVNSKEVTSEPDRNSKILFQAGMTF